MANFCDNILCVYFSFLDQKCFSHPFNLGKFGDRKISLSFYFSAINYFFNLGGEFDIKKTHFLPFFTWVALCDGVRERVSALVAARRARVLDVGAVLREGAAVRARREHAADAEPGEGRRDTESKTKNLPANYEVARDKCYNLFSNSSPTYTRLGNFSYICRLPAS